MSKEKVDAFIEKKAEWKAILEPLRKLMLDAGLEETVKWGVPVYTWNGKNVTGLVAFKAYAGIWFYKGSLLKDPQGVLQSAQKGTQALLQWRFSSADELDVESVKSYVKEAIELEKAGKSVPQPKKKSFQTPDELEEAFQKEPELKERFEALTHSKKREYAEHIGGAKKEDTRRRRLEKALPLLRKGKGLNDKYKG